MDDSKKNFIDNLFDGEDDVNDITEKVIGCAFKVSNTLGTGFLESVYENALVIEIKKIGLIVEQQRPLQVLYKGETVGNFFADLLVEDKVLVELKTVRSLDDVHTVQCLNYLRATNIKICLLINFGKPKVEIKRVIN